MQFLDPAQVVVGLTRLANLVKDDVIPSSPEQKRLEANLKKKYDVAASSLCGTQNGLSFSLISRSQEG